jgi:hypothetical protein
VPYLTHIDFTRGVRELTELVDYITINLCVDINSSGIQQYYKNPKALEKLISETNKARINELGKIAALEYEKYTESPDFDFSNSVRRVY